MFFQKLCFSSNLVSLCQFRLIHSIFRSIEFFLKCFNKPLSVSIDQNCFSINRNSWIRFFKNLDLTCSNHFFKTFFLSLRLGKAPLRFFFHFPPKFLQGFPLPRLVRPLYPSFCIYFHVFMHKLMHFCWIFGNFQNWDFFGINPLFLKLIIGFCSYIDIFMSYIG